MPDQLAPQSIIQNSLASGEIAPGLYGRTDLAKFHQSALLAKNWFVDYKGGMSTRCGTQLIGTSNTSGFVRLLPFKFSATVGQTYILVFSNHLLEFIKNPGGNAYPNSSNSGFYPIRRRPLHSGNAIRHCRPSQHSHVAGGRYGTDNV
jgi:hypothetical protein